MFDISNLVENHELFSNKKKKEVDKFQIETPENIWICEFICLRSKASSFRCIDKNTNKLKGTSKSQSKHIRFEEYKKCLDGENYQKECDTYISNSNNHEMYLQKVGKNLLFIFDDKRKYSNSIEKLPWN